MEGAGIAALSTRRAAAVAGMTIGYGRTNSMVISG